MLLIKLKLWYSSLKMHTQCGIHDLCITSFDHDSVETSIIKEVQATQALRNMTFLSSM